MKRHRVAYLFSMLFILNSATHSELTSTQDRTMNAKGSFEVTFSPQDDAVATGRMVFHKAFSGGMIGTSEGQMLSLRTKVNNSAAYVAIETFAGSINGLQGTVALQHTGIMDKGKDSLVIGIVPDSGTGELTGISGAFDIQRNGAEHLYTFEYSFDAPSEIE